MKSLDAKEKIKEQKKKQQLSNVVNKNGRDKHESRTL